MPLLGSDPDTVFPPRTLEGPLQRLEDPHHPQSALAVGQWPLAVANTRDEVLALEAQRLDICDSRAVAPPGAGDVLAVAVRVFIEPLVIDGELALERHVVEGRHPA